MGIVLSCNGKKQLPYISLKILGIVKTLAAECTHRHTAGQLRIVVLIALAAGGIFYAFTKQKQKKQAEKEALDPDANYTEDKGDFDIPAEDEPEDTGEEDTAEE